MAWIDPSPAELAADWIASRRRDADDTIGHLAQFLLTDFPRNEPELTWDTIQLVVKSYPEADFFPEATAEAQAVCGVLAAGPVEDLLSYHGERFIEQFEEAARLDPRVAWLAEGVWQFEMSDQVWRRIQLVADKSRRKRRSD